MKRGIKLIIILLIISSTRIGVTNSYFSAKVTVVDNHVSTGCWVAPSVPVLSQPANGSFVNSSWDADPKFDWQDSTINCSLSSVTEYQFEIYDDAGMAVLYYRSGWLSASEISLPAIPDGDYYWRVRSRDEFSNESSFSFLWKLTINRSAPIISNINALIATLNEADEKTATITWNTDELATSNLDWRIDGGGWTSLAVDITADNTSHSREITGLLANTTYYYRVKSSNSVGNEAVSAEQMFETGNERSGIGPWSDIVINEYLPNPKGTNNAPMPDGEWVELYNRGTTTKDLTGWYLTDADNSHKLYLTLANTVSSNPATSGLTIAPSEFLVVYRNGNSVFDLNNGSAGDAVELFGLETVHVGPFTWTITMLKDLHLYTGILGDEVLENKSFARFPDGTDNWFDPIPSPNGPNRLEEPTPTPTPTICGPQLDLSILGRRKVSFVVSCASDYKKLDYELNYFGPFGEKGINGSVENNPVSDKIQKDNIKLGTCSTLGEVCTYDEGVTKVNLKVTLLNQTGGEVILEKEENY